MAQKASSQKNKSLNLALQGGGTHGAYAWGILDKILEDGRIDIEAISATSAGSMNATALAYGMHKGGRERAREALHDLWENISKAGQFYSPVRRTPFDESLFQSSDNSLSYMAFKTFTRVFSPYQYNPFDINPLKDIMEDCVDFEELRRCDCIKIFINATNVATGKPRIFHTNEITLDAVMASAALPDIFKAVEIDGQQYWDGGYLGNPALYPLFYNTDCCDLMIVHINPLERPELPQTAPDIMNRLNEISFNSSLMHEVRAIVFVKKLIEQDMLKDEFKDQYKDILLHSIRADSALCDLSVASKYDSAWDFLISMRDKGQKQAALWLDKHFTDLGKKTTADLEDFLETDHPKQPSRHHAKAA